MCVCWWGCLCVVRFAGVSMAEWLMDVLIVLQISKEDYMITCEKMYLSYPCERWCSGKHCHWIVFLNSVAMSYIFNLGKNATGWGDFHTSYLFSDHDSVPQGDGTREDTLLRVLVSRSEVDLKKILEEYSAMYDKTLQEHLLVKLNIFVWIFPPLMFVFFF